MLVHCVATLRITDGIVEEASCPECGHSILPIVAIDRSRIEDVIYEHLKETHPHLTFIESSGSTPFDFSDDEGDVDVNVLVD